MDGNVLGIHRGIIHYTVGQRKGLGLALKHPMYVQYIDVDNNEVVLGSNEDLFKRELTAHNFNWVSIACQMRLSELKRELDISTKRHQHHYASKRN